MTQDQLMRLGLAAVIAPALFVCEHVQKKYGRLDLDDLNALGDDEQKAIQDAMPRDFMMRVADRMDAEMRDRVAEMLGPERLAKVYEVVATVLRAKAKAEQ